MTVHLRNVEAYFQYHPSLAPNILALILFFLVTLVISVQNGKHRSPYMWIVSFTGGLEVGGYISRLVAARTADLNAYITQLVVTILAPSSGQLHDSGQSGGTPEAVWTLPEHQNHCWSLLRH